MAYTLPSTPWKGSPGHHSGWQPWAHAADAPIAVTHAAIRGAALANKPRTAGLCCVDELGNQAACVKRESWVFMMSLRVRPRALIAPHTAFQIDA